MSPSANSKRRREKFNCCGKSPTIKKGKIDKQKSLHGEERQVKQAEQQLKSLPTEVFDRVCIYLGPADVCAFHTAVVSLRLLSVVEKIKQVVVVTVLEGLNTCTLTDTVEFINKALHLPHVGFAINIPGRYLPFEFSLVPFFLNHKIESYIYNYIYKQGYSRILNILDIEHYRIADRY